MTTQTTIDARTYDHGRTAAVTTAATARAACRVLADAFAADPWANYVLGAPGSDRPKALSAVMRAPVEMSRRYGGLVVEHDSLGRVAAAASWVPADHMHVGAFDAFRTGAIFVPFAVGPRTMRRLVGDDAELATVVARHRQPADAYLWVLGVRRELHGQGLGRAVVDQTCEHARSTGHRRVILNTDNPSNVATYQRLGFELCGTQQRPSGLVAHVMVRPLH
jgi:ribosomal protein S18 acetylase RimI-like enzyme